MPSKKTKTTTAPTTKNSATTAPVAKVAAPATTAPVAKVAAATTAPVAKVAAPATTAPVAKVAAPATTNDSAPTDTEVSTATTQDLINSYNATIADKWKQINALQASIRADERSIDKIVSKELKAYAKILKKKDSRKNAAREPKGIAEKRTLSNELAAFIKQPEGTKMTSSAVTSLVCDYVKANKLNDANEGTKIYPDEKLRTLLGVEKGTVVVSVGTTGTGVHLQTALAKHFQSNTAV